MSSNTTLSSAARSRLLAFNGFVWIFGIVAIIVIGVAVLAETGDEVSASDDYGYEPWLNPDPVLADDEGDGVYSGVDGAMVALDGLDPAQPLLITELDDTYVGEHGVGVQPGLVSVVVGGRDLVSRLGEHRDADEDDRHDPEDPHESVEPEQTAASRTAQRRVRTHSRLPTPTRLYNSGGSTDRQRIGRSSPGGAFDRRHRTHRCFELWRDLNQKLS